MASWALAPQAGNLAHHSRLRAWVELAFFQGSWSLQRGATTPARAPPQASTAGGAIWPAGHGTSWALAPQAARKSTAGGNDYGQLAHHRQVQGVGGSWLSFRGRGACSGVAHTLEAHLRAHLRRGRRLLLGEEWLWPAGHWHHNGTPQVVIDNPLVGTVYGQLGIGSHRRAHLRGQVYCWGKQ